MRQRSNGQNRNEIGIPWASLPQTVKRIAGKEILSPRKEAGLSFGKDADTIVFWGLIEPWNGVLEYRAEGVAGNGTHILYCNRTCGPGDDRPVTLERGHRIVGPDGLSYRVSFVDDAAGQRHHFEAILVFIAPQGD